ncbi:MAG TPA: hypothetical protein VFA68_00895 [Terriglobales bacterium]|nr:hypothetical protein [Terriglobales bacterium]
MKEDQVASWRDLCNAALTARDPERLLQIIRELNAALDREEKARNRVRRLQSDVPGKEGS